MGELYDHTFKFLLIGNSGVGKSCVLNQFVEDQFRVNSTHTIGVEFASKILSVGNKKIKLQIWDTAGQERFRAVTRAYYRKAVGALLVYDVTDRDSFNNLGQWLADLKQISGEGIVIILVGNKIDKKEEYRHVSFLEGSQFAIDNNLMFIETSALTGQNVADAFINVTRRVLVNVESFYFNDLNRRSDSLNEYRSPDLRRPYLRNGSANDACSC